MPRLGHAVTLAPVLAPDADFARLVSLACHDLRTPLATVQGFARTLLGQQLEERHARWLEMIDAASAQMAQLLDDLSLAARVEGGRYEPLPREADSLALARAADPDATGEGTAVSVDAEAVERALAALAAAARRHGGGVDVAVRVDGARVGIAPVTDAAPVVLGEEMKDLGAAVAVRVLAALGGSVAHEGDTVWVTLPR